MAQVKMNSIFEDMKGKIDNVVIFHRNGKTFVRRYVKPRKRLDSELTQAERNAREKFRKAREMVTYIKADKVRIERWKRLFEEYNEVAERLNNHMQKNCKWKKMKKYSTLEGYIMGSYIELFNDVENDGKLIERLFVSVVEYS